MLVQQNQLYLYKRTYCFAILDIPVDWMGKTCITRFTSISFQFNPYDSLHISVHSHRVRNETENNNNNFSLIFLDIQIRSQTIRSTQIEGVNRRDNVL